LTEVRLVVAEAEAGTRLDTFVSRHIPALSRRAAGALCASGGVTVDGRPGTKGGALVAGAVIVVRVPDPARPTAETGAGLVVVLERDDLVIVDKPAGQPTAPLTSQERGTLVNALLGRYPDLLDLGFGGLEPGIVHRLDNQTSGLVIVARCPQTFARLREVITAELLEKRYLAVVEDHALPPVGEVTAPVVPHERSARRVRVVPAERAEHGPRPATTRFRVVARAAGLALLEVEARRAARHQIRAHLASAGHPIVGDAVYGGAAHPALAARHALHASFVRWGGDAIVAAFSATAPLPPELAALGPWGSAAG